MPDKITITVVYNNVLLDKKLKPAWGFSCLIEGTEKTLLFDTGGDGSILLANMKKLGVDPGRVEIVFLSHAHGDHTGGLEYFLKANPEVVIYLPRSFSKSLQGGLKNIDWKVVPVGTSVEVCPGVWSTGEMGSWIKEESMVMETERGLVVIAGCAHPGIVKIVEKARDLRKRPIYLVMGGFHLMGYGDWEMEKIIKKFDDLKVQKVGPSHCTGEEQIGLFQRAWGEDFINLGLGGRVEIE